MRYLPGINLSLDPKCLFRVNSYRSLNLTYDELWKEYLDLINEEMIMDRIDMRGKHRDLAFRMVTTFFGTLVVFLAYGFVEWLGFDLAFKFNLTK